MLALIADLPRRYGRKPTDTYVPELDGLRCLAILLVLVWHASLRADRFLFRYHGGAAGGDLYAYFPHGEIGVALFFFISGFVVAKPFLVRPRRAWAVGRFYGRRLVRIYPPYVVALSGCFIVLAVLGLAPSDAQSFQQTGFSLSASYAASLFYLHSVILDSPSRLNPPMWSLEIEVLFYAAVPVLLFLYTAVGSRSRRYAVAGSVILALVLVNSDLVGLDLRLRWGLLSHLYILLLGVVVADVDSLCHWRSRSLGCDGLTAAGLLLLWGVGLCMTEHDAKMPTSAYALMLQASIVAALLLTYAGARTGRLSRRVLANPWICLIGTMCYSIYLTHIVTMQVLSEGLGKLLRTDDPGVVYGVYLMTLVGLSVVVASGFYLLFERPFAQGRLPDRLVGSRFGDFVARLGSGPGREVEASLGSAGGVGPLRQRSAASASAGSATLRWISAAWAGWRRRSLSR